MEALAIRKEQILRSLLKFMVLLGAVAYVPSIYACIVERLLLLGLIDSVAYLSLVVVAFARRIGYRARLTFSVLLGLFVGAAVLFTTGNDGAGHLWLIAAVVISALFGSIRAVVLTIGLAEGTMVVYGVLIATGIVDSSVSPVGLIAISANLLLISVTLALITHKLLACLAEEVGRQKEVLQLLDHRVKNNLQTIESLVAMEFDPDTPEAEGVARLLRRTKALSSANSLLLASPNTPQVHLRSLVELLVRPEIDLVEGHSTAAVTAEKLSETTVFLCDLFARCEEAGAFAVVFGADGSAQPSATKRAGRFTIRLQHDADARNRPFFPDGFFAGRHDPSWLAEGASVRLCSGVVEAHLTTLHNVSIM